MRIAITTLAVLVLTFGAFSLASGDDKKDDSKENKALVKMRAEIEALQMEVGYLRERETALSDYVLKNEARGRGLKAVVVASRKAGFEANRIPAESRKLLLGGLEAAAVSIGKDLPAVTKEQVALLKKLVAFRKANGLSE